MSATHVPEPKARRVRPLDDQPVDHDLDVVDPVAVHAVDVVQVADDAVDAGLHVAVGADAFEQIAVVPPAAAHERRQERQPRPGRHVVDGGKDLLEGLMADLLPAVGAVGRAQTREEQAQVVVDLRGRRHGRAGAGACHLLPDGDGRG
jgi:hypothetical protein